MAKETISFCVFDIAFTALWAHNVWCFHVFWVLHHFLILLSKPHVHCVSALIKTLTENLATFSWDKLRKTILIRYTRYLPVRLLLKEESFSLQKVYKCVTTIRGFCLCKRFGKWVSKTASSTLNRDKRDVEAKFLETYIDLIYISHSSYININNYFNITLYTTNTFLTNDPFCGCHYMLEWVT